MNSRKVGGFSALYAGCAYIIGFVVLLLILSPEQASEWTPSERLAFFLENSILLHLWNSIIYTIFGIVLIFLTIALDTHISRTHSVVKSTAKSLGLIWAGLLIASGMIANVGMEKVSSLFATEPENAVRLWQTLGVIQDGLGGGVEILGGLWVLMLSSIAWRAGTFTSAFNGFGILVGVAGCITVFPGLGGAGAIFGLGQIVWFFWLSVLFFKEVNIIRNE